MCISEDKPSRDKDRELRKVERTVVGPSKMCRRQAITRTSVRQVNIVVFSLYIIYYYKYAGLLTILEKSIGNTNTNTISEKYCNSDTNTFTNTF